MHTVKIYLAVAMLSFATQTQLTGTPPGQSRITVNLSREYDLESPIKSLSLNRRHGKPNVNMRFAKLKNANAFEAKELTIKGLVIGEYTGKKVPSNKEIFWLIGNDTPDANRHLLADVHLMDSGEDVNGHWWLLVSEDEYSTNRNNRDTYDFGIHVHRNGTVRLVNPKFIGKESNTPSDPGATE